MLARASPDELAALLSTSAFGGQPMSAARREVASSWAASPLLPLVLVPTEGGGTAAGAGGLHCVVLDLPAALSIERLSAALASLKLLPAAAPSGAPRLWHCKLWAALSDDVTSEADPRLQERRCVTVSEDGAIDVSGTMAAEPSSLTATATAGVATFYGEYLQVFNGFFFFLNGCLCLLNGCFALAQRLTRRAPAG